MPNNNIATDPLIGQQLANFRLEHVIGRGGMAIVYYGIDVKLNRPVAVKVIDARYRNDPAYAERFIRESQVVATWRHPNVLQVYYADDENELYYFVMEYIDGLDLRQLIDMYLDEGQLMPIEDVLRIGRAVAEALDYAHARGVVHRDIKPSNVMVSYDGRVLLTDFGLALQITEGSMGEVFGTPHYMAPEQAKRSADAVAASDLYSLGVLLFEMLTGAVPFDDSSPTSVALAHITQPPPSPRSINPELNQVTEDLLLKALEKQPADRYQSGRDLIDALQKALEEGAEEFESDALPPLPATVQRTPTGASIPTVSDVTVAERLSLQLATRAEIPTLLNDPNAADSGTSLSAWLRNPYFIGAAVALLVLIAVAGGYFLANGNGFFAGATSTPLPEIAVIEPIQSSTPTYTPTATATWTPTTTPTHTPTATATTTPTPTANATAAPGLSPTEILLPTDVPTASLTPSPTPEPALLLIYNRDGFYVLNVSDQIINLDPLVLNALDQEGNSTQYVFQALFGWRFKNLSPGYCGGIELAGVTSPLRPNQCEGFGMLTFPGSTSDEYFWADRMDEGIDKFRVSWLGETVQICSLTDLFCSVSIPVDN